jgi:3-phosphoshikimate 1-carboxyvinyltransferase
MLAALGAEITESTNGTHRVELEAFSTPPFDLAVAGDVSSAAYLVAIGLLSGSVSVDGVGLNPSRIGFLRAVRRMGGAVEWDVREERMNESVGTIDVRRSALHGIEIEAAIVPTLVDEVPLLGVLATQADGETVVGGAEELRIKESDRIAALTDALRALGADIDERPDGFVVRGPTVLEGAVVDAAGDHRIAMSLAVAGAAAKGETRIEGFECAAVSWPGFENALASLGVEVEIA